MKKRLLMAAVLWPGATGWAGGQETSTCLMSPPYRTMQADTLCDSIADANRVREPADCFDVLVAADGPTGSGRYWTVAIGLAEPGQTVPQKGFCLMTNTLRWRTLQGFSPSPLPWLGDRDSDGRPEVIIWDSFPLREEATAAEHGLMAWFYQVDPEGVLTID
jgi:hypothetical protein